MSIILRLSNTWIYNYIVAVESNGVANTENDITSRTGEYWRSSNWVS